MQEPAPPAIACIRFVAEGDSAGERLARWRERVAGFYDVEPTPVSQAQAFHMDTSSWHLGGLIAGTARFGAREQQRTPRHARADQVDHYRLLLQTAGRVRVDADGRQATVEPGSVLLTDASRPERYSTEDGSNIVLFLPRDLLDEALPRPLDLHGLVPRGAAASVLVSHLQSLLRHIDSITPAEAPDIAQATVRMIAAGLAPSAATLERARPSIESTLLRQACRYVELHLADPDLSAQHLCVFFGLSRATLYRLFEPLGGVSSFIKERRLERVHEVLRSTDVHRQLGLVADRHGFKSAAHFSRAFRERFGFSPGDVKRQGAAPVVPSGDATARLSDAGFVDWLRALRA